MERYFYIPDYDAVFTVVACRNSFQEHDKNVPVYDFVTNKMSTVSAEFLQHYPISSLVEYHDPPSDLITLQDVHSASILNTLRVRFSKDLVYTSIGPILVALNPFKWIQGLYDDSLKHLYAQKIKNLSDDPHVFGIVDEALSGLHFGKDQSLIISGESGAGKTESTKQCLHFLATISGSHSDVHNKVLQTSPILEGFGNAKTLRNNNSSRFGKFIELGFDQQFSIIDASNTTYLLEKSRVVFQDKGERNFHIFYQLLRGASEETIRKYFLKNMCAQLESVSYINQSGCIHIDGVDDAGDYRDLMSAFEMIGIPSTESDAIISAVAAILHLGNVLFEEDPDNSDACVISACVDVQYSLKSFMVSTTVLTASPCTLVTMNIYA